jgi:hypothetical protein
MNLNGHSKHRLPLLTLALLVATSGCGFLMTEPQPLEGGLVFQVQETHIFNTGAGEPLVAFFVETELEYPSISYSLRGSVGMQGTEIRADFTGVVPCGGCADMVGPAQQRVILPLAEGEYPLTVTYRGNTDRYLVVVTSEAIEVRTVSASFTTPRFELFWRYPPNSFVYLCGAAGQEAACGEFRNILQTTLALQPLSFSPSGEVPYPYGGEVWRTEYYRYGSEADFEMAVDLLRTFLSDRAGLWLRLVNWRNERYPV